ncbi:MAG TPA: isocitrate/isopropylmalate dehydrogenase family protein [Bacillales bacterium]|nr:isocitrate/isopropylmalate dehydrogenase family protein [Bacillales bacterium]
MKSVEIAVLEGDGIGPDIVQATMRVLEKACAKQGVRTDFSMLPSGLSALESHGSTLPQETLDKLPDYSGWILGPVTHHTYPINDKRFINPSGYLRKNYELFANIRPSRAFPGVKTKFPEVDLVVVRENTEGMYADRNVLDGNGEFRPTEDTVVSVRVVTRKASLRVARQAFELARSRRGKVTAVHKANVLRRGCGLFLECCKEVAKEYPDIELNDFHVDAFAMMLVMYPERFDVIVTTNLFGDVLSDEAAGLVGGLGLAPGLNAGIEHAMGQATHGSAPDIAELHIANPVAEILSGKLLLDWLAAHLSMPELFEAAKDVERGVAETLKNGKGLTPDLGGTAHTDEMTDVILSEMG